MSIQVSSAPLESGQTQSTAAQTRTAYLAKLLELAQATAIGHPSLQVLRDHARLRVQEQTFPSTREEEWRFTDLSELLTIDLAPADCSTPVGVETVSPFLLPDTLRLVFVNGSYAPELSSTADLPVGLTIGNLSSLPEQQLQDLVQNYLGKQSGSEEVFTALNTAGLTDAAIVLVAKNQVIETPIHLLLISTANQPALIQPRCLVVAEPNSAITVIEDYITASNATYLTNAVTEIWLAENAQVNHTRVQRDHQAAFHIGKTAVSQARTSRYSCTAVSFGAQLSRHNLDVYQTGEQTETILNGLTVLQDQQIGDTHSTIGFTKPYGTSRQLHKCIIDDRGHGIFNGKVFVPKAAQLTDAGQLNRTLLLSPKARVDTKPQLEIVADNVKCTHGATVGQLETDEIFYLQSRGIDADSARKLLVYAFAFEIIDQIPVTSLRQNLLNAV
jgi:Fe-S cluster assembly protein SufD